MVLLLLTLLVFVALFFEVFLLRIGKFPFQPPIFLLLIIEDTLEF